MNSGKLEVMRNLRERTQTDILGISKQRWTGAGHFKSDNYCIYYSGNEDRRENRVALTMKGEITKSVMGYHPINIRSRLISLRLKGILK